MIDEINKVIEEFEKLGYSHEEATNIVEAATNLSDEEFEKFKTIYIPVSKSPKPIKIVYQDNWKIEKDDGYNITLSKRLSKAELANLVHNIGDSNVSIIGEDVYYCPTCNRILERIDIDSCMNTPNKIVDYCLDCYSEVIKLKRE